MVRNKKSGFTLIELLVVVIIVAVLAAVALPLMTGNIMQARVSEAEAGLGTIRTQFRALQAQGVGFSTVVTGAGAAVVGNVPGIAAGDLSGRYFSDDDFTVFTVGAAGAPTYCIAMTSDGQVEQGATRAGLVNGQTRSMDQNGDLFADAACTAPAINS